MQRCIHMALTLEFCSWLGKPLYTEWPPRWHIASLLGTCPEGVDPSDSVYTFLWFGLGSWFGYLSEVNSKPPPPEWTSSGSQFIEVLGVTVSSLNGIASDHGLPFAVEPSYWLFSALVLNLSVSIQKASYPWYQRQVCLGSLYPSSLCNHKYLPTCKVPWCTAPLVHVPGGSPVERSSLKNKIFIRWRMCRICQSWCHTPSFLLLWHLWSWVLLQPLLPGSKAVCWLASLLPHLQDQSQCDPASCQGSSS